jgi:hypothetical protein
VFAVLVTIQSYTGSETLHKPSLSFLFFWVNIVPGIMSLVVLIGHGRVRRKGLNPPSWRQNVSKIILSCSPYSSMPSSWNPWGSFQSLSCSSFISWGSLKEEMVLWSLWYCGDSDFLLVFGPGQSRLPKGCCSFEIKEGQGNVWISFKLYLWFRWHTSP